MSNERAPALNTLPTRGSNRQYLIVLAKGPPPFGAAVDGDPSVQTACTYAKDISGIATVTDAYG